MAEFINGLVLNQHFYEEVVAPLLRTHFPDLEYSAGLIGWGSDVLGYDDRQSTDHNWGPRFQIFLPAADYDTYHTKLEDVLGQQLPQTFRGYPTAFPLVGDVQPSRDDSPVHNLEIWTIRDYFIRYLGCDPYGEIKAADWLSFAEHKLLAITSGRVFHDGLGELEMIRQKFRYYPHDIWLYMLAAQWEKISEEQAFVGRCGYVGDELGSALIAGRQVRNLMKLCFLMEHKYAPYSKWFGTAFGQLAPARELSPIFMQVLQSREWQARQDYLAQAYEIVARMHNTLGITIAINEPAVQYFDRPYLVLGDGRQAEELRKTLQSEEVKRIPHLLGSVNQLIDSDDKLNSLELCHKLKELYEV
jgi:Domain of unknown function (DUF4037)